MKIEAYYADMQKLHVNTLPDRAYFIPFSSEEGARAGLREHSSRMQLLNGSWKFAWYASVEEVPDKFYLPELDPCEMDNIDVPGCWQPQGFDRYHYTGCKHVIPADPPYLPADIPCGTYLTDFTVALCGELPVAELVFEGVDACFYVWVNGIFVGYSEVSHATSIFDITPCLKEGRNRLAVLNLKWCTGTYFEAQDKWRMSGIFRDVYLLRRPEQRLADFFIRQEVAADGSWAVLRTEFAFCGETAQAKVRLYAPDGELAAEAMAEAGSEAGSRAGGGAEDGTGTGAETRAGDGAETGAENDVETRAEDGAGARRSSGCVLRAVHRVREPLLWTAETPYLYTMVIELPGEVVAQKVGIRRISVEKGVIYLNGHRIRFKGVNRHDTDPVTGYTVDREHIRRDLVLMKQNNINAIRTSHYPNSPLVMELCNELGLYVMSEADYEIHGIVCSAGDEGPLSLLGKQDESSAYRYFTPQINDGALYERAAVDRMKKNAIRDKNQGCILFWSLGNESGWGKSQEIAAAWLKQYDPDRLVHYENLFPAPGREPDYSNLDVVSRMYSSIYWIQEKYGDLEGYDGSMEINPHLDPVTEELYREAMKEKPFLLCEYIHAMGNSSGDAEDYFQVMERYERFAGGFVWEWADHAKYIGDDRAGKPMYQYGGDSGEYPTDGSFCMDGLNFPDRRPHTSLKEYKNVLRPVRARWGIPNRTLILRNMLNVADMGEELEASYELSRGGQTVQSGSFVLPHCAPWQEAEIPLPLPVPEEGECYLKLTYRTRRETPAVPSGFELGFDQLPVSVPAVIQPEPACGEGTLWVKETDRVIVAGGVSPEGEYEYTFDKKAGTFRFLKVKGRQLLDRPMEYNISRAPTDNDRGFGHIYESWKDAGYYDAVTRVYGTEWEADASALRIRVRFGMAAVFRRNALTARAVWTVYADGRIALDCQVDRQPDAIYLPRFGIRLFLKRSVGEKVSYFGYGPHESYVDKRHSCYKAVFDATVDGLFEDYVRPQENGSHWGVSWLDVGDQEGAGLFVLPGREPFSFNVSRYPQEALEEAKHNYELVPSNSIVVCLDYMQSGIGSNSCGPVLLEKYQLRQAQFDFAIVLKPRA